MADSTHSRAAIAVDSEQTTGLVVVPEAARVMNLPPAPRLRISRQIRQQLFLRSGEKCENGCDTAIKLDTFHVAHLRAHANGGGENIENLQAWCTTCNYEQGSKDVTDTRISPRAWQLEALDRIVERIAHDSAATVVAAPGAGKTVFAGLVFEALYAAGVVDRMVVLAPRTTLVTQWADSLWRARQIQLKPGDALERNAQHGVVLTYQALQNPQTVEVLRMKSAASRTLLVLDEVHHVGEPVNGQPNAWARDLRSFVGTVDKQLNVAGVLNMSGTLWRSAPGEMISTVRYEKLPDGRLRALYDYEVTADRLIIGGELRSLDLFRLDARIRAADLSDLEIVDSDMADLDDEDVSRFALRASMKSDDYRQSFIANVLDRLEEAHRSLDNYHVKALIVAARQDEARSFADEANRQMRERGLSPLAVVATSDDAAAAKTLKDFKGQKRVGVLCTVDMAGEGYDCPDIVVVGYATNKLTTLYVRQVVARAMRVTDKERQLGWIHPAVIVTPDIPLLVNKLVAYLAPFMHEVYAAEDDVLTDGQPLEPTGQTTLLPRFELQDLVPGAEAVTYPHLDGTRYDFQGGVVAAMAKQLADAQLPPSWATRVLVATQRTVGDLLDSRPFELGPEPRESPISGIRDQPAVMAPAPRMEPSEPTRQFDSIEGRAQLIQDALHKLEGWWHVNGGTPVPLFVAQANAAAGIAKGERRRADLPRLARALEFEQRACAAKAGELGIHPPRGARSVE